MFAMASVVQARWLDPLRNFLVRAGGRIADIVHASIPMKAVLTCSGPHERFAYWKNEDAESRAASRHGVVAGRRRPLGVKFGANQGSFGLTIIFPIISFDP